MCGTGVTCVAMKRQGGRSGAAHEAPGWDGVGPQARPAGGGPVRAGLPPSPAGAAAAHVCCRSGGAARAAGRHVAHGVTAQRPAQPAYAL